MAYGGDPSGTAEFCKSTAAALCPERRSAREATLCTVGLIAASLTRPMLVDLALVELVGQKLAVQCDADAITGRILDPVGSEVDRAHDPVTELLVDQNFERGPVHLDELIEAVDGRIDGNRSIQSSTRRDLLQRGGRLMAEAQRRDDVRCML